MIIRTVTQKCPVCGYIFKKQSELEVRTIPPSRLITCKPGYGPVRHDYPTEREFVVNSKILAGDVEFIRISKHLISCPKCGICLSSKVCMTDKKNKWQVVNSSYTKNDARSTPLLASFFKHMLFVFCLISFDLILNQIDLRSVLLYQLNLYSLKLQN